MEKIEEISFNIKKLSLLDININELLCIVKIWMNYNKQYFDYLLSKKWIESLESKGYIVHHKKDVYLRAKGKKIIDLFISSNKDEDNSKYSIMTDEYRSLFKGIKNGSMGDRNSVKSKLIRFLKENPNTSFNEIKLATKKYIESLNGNYNFIRRADYFIYKQTGLKKEEISDLSTWIEIIREEPENSDWRTNLC